jgi:cullin-associated NEDD8-dissociated protein 1
MVGESDAKQKYLFLNTIREIVISDSDCLSGYLTPLMDLLMSQTGHPEDSIRSIVAECLGRLFIVYPEDLIDQFDAAFAGKDPVVKATLARSAKYSGQKISNELMYTLLASSLINLASESDPDVKRSALEGLTTMVHTDWKIIKDNIKDLEEFAHGETTVRKDLIDEVDLGPFKHKVDRGLPMRKSAFQLLETLFDRGAADYCDMNRLVEAVTTLGLIDAAEEVSVLNLHILAKLTQRANVVVVSRID